ncbi:MAG: 30S ribosomal protein S17 [Patescibacteria group bacterium]
MEQEKEQKNNIKRTTIKGVVVSNKMDKTLVVLTKRFVKHPKYGKYRSIAKKYKVHYDDGKYEIGDTVEIIECNPISKEKRFRVKSQKLESL